MSIVLTVKKKKEIKKEIIWKKLKMIKKIYLKKL